MKAFARGIIRRRPAFGFTLIELMTVVVIIGILVVFLLGNVQRTICKAKESRTFNNLNAIRAAIGMFKSVDGRNYHSGSNFSPPATVKTNGYPWALKESPTEWRPALGSSDYAGGDDETDYEVEKGKYDVWFNRYMASIPFAEVGKDCKLFSYGDGKQKPDNGVWQQNYTPEDCKTAMVNIGNYRGWWYCNTDGTLLINSYTESTEGKKRYYLY